MNKTIHTPEEAKSKGYVALTYPCKIDSPRPHIKAQHTVWFQGFLRDLEGTEALLVDTSRGIEFWRHRAKMDIFREEFNRSSVHSINPYVRH